MRQDALRHGAGPIDCMVRYEYPLHEGVRTMLRLEHLFDRLGQLIERETALDHHFALATLFDIVDVASRADVKSDLLKELERHRAQMHAFRGKPGVSEQALDAVLGRIEHAFQVLHAMQGKAGSALASHEFLMSVRSRISIPAGTCEFDLPAYFGWQQQETGRRRADLMQWVSTLMPLAWAISSIVGSRPFFWISRLVTLRIFDIVSIMCTGMRIVRAWSAIERVIAWRIHQVA